MFVLDFYDENTKTFCRGFAAIYNFYISLSRSDVSKNSDAGEHVGV